MANQEGISGSTAGAQARARQRWSRELGLTLGWQTVILSNCRFSSRAAMLVAGGAPFRGAVK
jgi:hypothetical protein